ncbi:MAG: YdcF family protein [Eubacterium sp.]
MTEYLKTLFGSLVPALIFWDILAFSMFKDRSRYRNTVYLMIALIATIPFIAAIFDPKQDVAIGIILACILLLILAVPAILTANGIIMIRREGKSLANVLSLFVGIGVSVGECCLIAFLFISSMGIQSLARSILFPILIIIAVTVTYASMVFVAFMFYTLLLQSIPHKRDFDYVIIHGCGLIGGHKVSKLLADRLDRAIEIYQKDPTPPILIPSGGRGSDESLSEADAMAGYLLEHGIPEDHILKEDQSATTLENLKFSKKLIDSQQGRKYTVLVTSNYHVFRALRYARQISLKCTGVGAHTAAYYWPSALIREFIAVHAEKKHMILFFIGWVIIMMPTLAMLFIR